MTQQGNDSMALIARIRRATCIHGIELSPGELSLAMSLVGLDIVARLAPHAPNVTPIAASAVFAGMVLRSRALALAVPISALLLSDLVVGSYDWRIAGVVYAALALPALAARWGRARPVVVLAPLVLSSSLLFFATTNFAVWAFSGMYAHDLHGLVHCYVASFIATSRRCRFSGIPWPATCSGRRCCSAPGGVQNSCSLRRRAACCP